MDIDKKNDELILKDEKNTDTVNDKPSKRPHLKRSNCIITINTNKRIDSKDPSLPKIINNLEGIFSRVFTAENVFNSVIFRERAPYKKIDNYGFKQLIIEYGFELGPKTKTLHAHVVLGISHYTLIKLDTEKIHDMIKSQFKDIGIDSFYFNIRWNYGANQSLIDMIRYVHKDQDKIDKLKNNISD